MTAAPGDVVTIRLEATATFIAGNPVAFWRPLLAAATCGHPRGGAFRAPPMSALAADAVVVAVEAVGVGATTANRR